MKKTHLTGTEIFSRQKDSPCSAGVSLQALFAVNSNLLDMAQAAPLALSNCGFQFKSPPMMRPGGKKERAAFEKVRTFEFKSVRGVLCLDAYLYVVAQKKTRAPDRHAVIVRRFLFNLADLFSNGCRTGFWSDRLEFKVVDGHDVQYKRMWRTFPDHHDRSVRFIFLGTSPIISCMILTFSAVFAIYPHKHQDFLSGSKRSLKKPAKPWKQFEQYRKEEIDALGERIYNAGKRAKKVILNQVEPVIRNVFTNGLKPLSGRGMWDAEEQLRVALWRREQSGVDADDAEEPDEDADDADEADDAVDDAEASAGGADAAFLGADEAAGGAEEAPEQHVDHAEDEVQGGADIDDDADAASAADMAAPAAASAADPAAEDVDDIERVPDDYLHSHYACIRLFSTFCVVFGFERDNAMLAEIDPEGGLGL